jgi:hypothetical protein
MPPTARYVCHQWGLLDQIDARLSGWWWNLFGIQVDPTPGLPPYPFVRLDAEDGTMVQVQVWLWQICRASAPAWAELRWHPKQETTVTFVHLSADAQTRRQQVADLDRAVKLTIYTMQRGRPLHSGSTAGLSDEELLAEIEALVREYWQKGERPKAKLIAKYLSRALSESALRRFINGRVGMTWDPFIEKYRPR